MISLENFLHKYNESIFEDYPSTIYYACYNNDIEILEWLNNEFVKEDFKFCENILEDLIQEGKFMSLQWLYKNYKEIFNNFPFLIYILENNIIYKLKILKYKFGDNFKNYIGEYIKNNNETKIIEFFFRFYNMIKDNIDEIIKNVCYNGDIDMLNFLIKNNYYNNYNFILQYIETINTYQKKIISDYICNQMLNFVELKIC